jgi:hypothetical protein
MNPFVDADSHGRRNVPSLGEQPSIVTNTVVDERLQISPQRGEGGFAQEVGVHLSVFPSETEPSFYGPTQRVQSNRTAP